MPAFSELIDDFNDGVIGAAWSPSYGTIRESGGRAAILSENGYPALRSQSVYSLVGSSVFIRAIPAPLGNATGSVTSEALVDSPTGGTRLLIAVDTFSNQIQFRSDVGYGDGAGVNIPYDATAHAWWRFREAAGTVYMETSPDTVTWTIRRQVPTPAWITTGNNPLHFSTHRETGDLATYYFEVDSVNVAPILAPPQTPEAMSVTPSDTSAVMSWPATEGATGYDVEYRTAADPDYYTAKPWELTTIPGGSSSTWARTAGPNVSLSVTGRDANFIAPPAMTPQVLALDNNGREVVVTIQAATHGIKQADGSVLPCRLGRFPLPLEPVLPAHNPIPDVTPRYEQVTVSVDPSVRSYQYTTLNAVSPAATTLRAPSRIVTGDLLLMMIMVDSGTLAAASTLNANNGFTEMGRRASTQVRTAWAYKIATATDVGRTTFPIGGMTTSADGCAIILAVRDWSGTYSQTTFAMAAATNDTWVTPAVTPQTDRSLLMTFVSNNGNNGGKAWGFIPPVGAGAAGYTENAGGWNSGAVSSEIITGTTISGTRTWKVNTNSTATLKMNAAISIPAGTVTKTITQMLNEYSATGGSGGPLTNRTNVTFEDSAGLSSTYHIFAEGLDWSKKVGLLVYTDGSGESGLTPEAITTLDPYVLYGDVGLIAVAKKHNMVLLTPRAPGDGCMDGDGVCWYDHSQNGVTPWQKLEWSNELIRKVLTEYNIDRRRIAIGGYSSGAQWTMSWFGPRYASEIMLDGIALGISYGGQPRVNPNLTTAYKANVEHIWNVGDADTAYSRPNWWDGVQTGRQWYIDNGFAVTELQLIPGLTHDRYDIVNGTGVGHFGAIYDTEIAARIIPS